MIELAHSCLIGLFAATTAISLWLLLAVRPQQLLVRER
jgi:hypothetical protein